MWPHRFFPIALCAVVHFAIRTFSSCHQFYLHTELYVKDIYNLVYKRFDNLNWNESCIVTLKLTNLFIVMTEYVMLTFVEI